MYNDPAATTPEQERAEAMQSDPDYYECPDCGAQMPDVDEQSTPGFTGATIYFATYMCCGYQDVDTDNDNLEAVR